MAPCPSRVTHRRRCAVAASVRAARSQAQCGAARAAAHAQRGGGPVYRRSSGSSALSSGRSSRRTALMCQHFDALLAKPSPAHLFGTDQLGRDVLSRVLAGSREVLILAPAATAHWLDRRHHHRAGHRLLRRLGRRDHHAHHGRDHGLPVHHPGLADPGRAGTVDVERDFGDWLRLHPPDRPRGARRRALGAQPRLCRGGAAARRQRAERSC